ncbi:MAG: isoaspartyl peptidase/L-asparaginase [Bacteroidetes bacterium]|nr:isoaspartyl peptidase/L-asparaginase [Bacteroidota bacterium]
MKNILLRFLNILTVPVLLITLSCSTNQNKNSEFGLVIHGGAGNIIKGSLTPEQEKEYETKLQEALETGYKILIAGGSSIDAVEKVINILEDSPLFNAGKGAVFTANGINELDASIMDGRTLNAGAAARLTHVKNPISLVRKIMDISEHVMLVGEGAEIFAEQNEIKLVDSSYFFTEKRWNDLQKIQIEKKAINKDQANFNSYNPDYKFGTVGCTALDKNGNLAAGTSTGGMTNKKFGRVGDSPIIGAGTYANNNSCAVSATGHGEFFIRGTIAHDISALIEYKGMSLNDAADEVINKKLSSMGGTGGIIAIDKKGNIAMPFNTAGMFRAFVLDDGKFVVKIYKE